MDKKHNLGYRPWEHEEKPVLINEKGYFWYVDYWGDSIIEREQRKWKNTINMKAFFIKKGDSLARAIIGEEQILLHTSTSMEAFSDFVTAYLLITRPDKEKIMPKINISKIMDKAIDKIVETFEEPLDEYEVHDLADLFKIKLNLASGNLTEKEAATGVYNISREDEWLACIFTSKWSDGINLVTDAKYNPETDAVCLDVSDLMPGKDAKLEEEYIDVMINGESHRRKVCPTCHKYIIRKGTALTYACIGCGYEEY